MVLMGQYLIHLYNLRGQCTDDYSYTSSTKLLLTQQVLQSSCYHVHVEGGNILISNLKSVT